MFTIVIGIVAADGYEKVGGEKGGMLTKKTVVTTIAVCCVGMISSLVVLLCSMNKDYVHTFVRAKTGNQHIQEIFKKS